MTTVRSHYSREDLFEALGSLGVSRGDVIFCHVSLGRLGLPPGGTDMTAASELLVGVLKETVGETGAVLVPTYSYSFGKGKPFDVAHTPSAIGDFTEYFRKSPRTLRSRDPMLSVAGWGDRSVDLFRDLPHTCYGRGSLYERLRHQNAMICVVGLGMHWATFRHHIEELAEVPFRFTKAFAGEIREGTKSSTETWDYSARYLTDSCRPDGNRLAAMVAEEGLSRTVPLGLSSMSAIRADQYFDFALEEMKREPWLSARGPACQIDELTPFKDP